MINNVETFANVPAVIIYGADWFSRIGTARSGGTKVFALAGKVRHTGLVEVPMGTSAPRDRLRHRRRRRPTASSSRRSRRAGRPAAASPPRWSTCEVDFDTLAKVGSIMGSGGMIVLDEDDCMVDIAKFFMTFSQDESCGKCTPCREGTVRMMEILDRITAGKGTLEDLDKLKRLGTLMKKTSLCGLGRAAPNPGAQHPGALPRRVPRPREREALPGQALHGAVALRDRRGEVRRLHALCPQLPGDVHRRHAPASRT